MKKFSVLLLFWVLQLLSVTSNADIAQGVDWLKGQAQADGSYSLESDISTAYQATSEVLRVFTSLEENAEPLAVPYMDSQTYHGTEYLSRKIITNVNASQDVQTLVDEILTHKNTDGGFGELSGYESTVIDTVFALQAIAVTGFTDSEVIYNALQFLQAAQLNSGGFVLESANENSDSIYITAQVLRTFQPYSLEFDLATPIQAAADFLFSQQSIDNTWGSNWETAQALIAIIPVTDDPDLYVSALTGLANAQSASGDWQEDVYITALSIQALDLAANVLTSGKLKGNVIDASTGQPLSGVNISVSPGGFQTQTAASGLFEIDNLEPGSYSIAYSHTGYENTTRQVELMVDQVVSIDRVELIPLSTTGNLSGLVVDANLKVPLSGVEISISPGVEQYETTSDGGFSIRNLEPGSYTISYAHPGFNSAIQQVEIVAGQTIYLGQVQLSPLPTKGIIRGTIRDTVTGEPLRRAYVYIYRGANSNYVRTDELGQFSIETDPGEIRISATKQYYVAASANLTVVGGTIYEFSPLLQPSSSDPFTLYGTILDAAAGTPLEGVTITVRSPLKFAATQTNADGSYELELDWGNVGVSVTASLTNYDPVYVNVRLYSGRSLEFSPLMYTRLSTPEDPALLKGTILDGNTYLPLEGVTIFAGFRYENPRTAVTGVDGTYEIEVYPRDLTRRLSIRTYLDGYDRTDGREIASPGVLMDYSPLLYPTGTTPDPNDVPTIMLGTVVDSESGEAIEGVLVEIESTTLADTTFIDGTFSIENVATGSTQISLIKAGYETLDMSVIIPAGAEADLGTIKMAKPASRATTTLEGVLTDIDYDTPISGAKVIIEGTDKFVFSDAEGKYRIEGIENEKDGNGVDQGGFHLLIQATGYISYFDYLIVSEPTTITLNLELSSLDTGRIKVLSVNTDLPEYKPYTNVLINAEVSNRNSAAKSVLPVFEFLDSQDNVVAQYSGLNNTGEHISIPRYSTTTISSGWYTDHFPTDTYRIRLKLLEGGVQVTANTAIFAISPVAELNNIELSLEPGYTVVGREQALKLDLAFSNKANIVQSVVVNYRWLNSDGSLFKEKELQFDLSPEEQTKTITLEDFAHTFTVSGKYPVTATISAGMNYEAATTLTVMPLLHIEPEQDLNPKEVPAGQDSTIDIHIRFKGVEQ